MNFFNRNLKNRMYHIFLLSIAIPVILVGIMLSIFFNIHTINVHKETTTNLLKSVCSNLDNGFDSLDNICFTPYLHKNVLQVMIWMENGYYSQDSNMPSYLNSYGYTQEYVMLFTKLLHTSNLKIQKISFFPLNSDTSYAITRNAAGLQPYHIDNLSEKEWYTWALNSDGKKTYFFGENETLYAVRLVKDFDSNKPVGILKIDFPKQPFLSTLSELSVDSFLVLSTEDNQIIYSNKSIPNGMLQSITSEEIYFNHNKYYITQQSSDFSGWNLIYIASRKDILANNLSIIAIISFIIVLSIVISFYVYKSKSTKIVRSVETILNTIHKLEQGNLSAKCVVDDNGDFSKIASALNKMGTELNHHIETEYQAIIRQRNAEYRALQSQINPHFLYNTLNGFMALNRMGERDLLEKSIIQLTGLFRHTCSNTDTTTVRQEIDFVEKYLELQKLRFDDLLEYQILCSPEAESIVIPKLLLQPLVENSVVHGMDNLQDSIMITINAVVNRNYLNIIIDDNGSGFDSNTLEPKNRVGLHNVQDRLYHFNEKSNFSITSQPQKGSHILISIPFNLEDDSK